MDTDNASDAANNRLRVVTLTRPDMRITDYGELQVFFDGACEPRNPGGWSTYGWCVLDNGAVELVSGYGLAMEQGHRLSTNNFAEYTALGMVLRWLFDSGWHGKLAIFGDSALVVNQVSCRWQCNQSHLRQLRDRVQELLRDLGEAFRITWIPREQNERCDRLSHRAYEVATGQPFPERRRRRK